MRQVVLAVLAACLGGPFAASEVAAAEPLTGEQVESIRTYVTTALDELGVPGAAVAVVTADGVAFAEGFGLADDSGRPVTPQTPFHIASVSKQLTALAVMQLVEDGAVDLDATVHDYLPWFGPEGDHAAITVRDLLAHTSGWSVADGLTNRTDGSSDDGALERNVRRLAATPLSHPVGEFEYSNANYDVLGLLVAQASGMSFEGFMRERVLEPLAMAHTHLTDEDARADGVAQGHYPFFGVTIAWDLYFVRGSVPSAYMASSAEDLGHVLTAHLNGGSFEGRVFLPLSRMAQLQDPLVEPFAAGGYGWGWWRYPLYEAGLVGEQDGQVRYTAPVILEHDGSHSTYASGVVLLPEAGYGIVVLLNLNDETTPSRFYQLHLAIAQIVTGVEPAPLTPYDDLIRTIGKPLFAGIVALQLVGVAWAIRNLRRWRRRPAPGIGSWTWIARHVALPLAVDLTVTFVAWWLVLDEAELGLTQVPVILRLAPDIGWSLVLIAVLGLGWGLLRTVLTLQLVRGPAGPQEAGSSA